MDEMNGSDEEALTLFRASVERFLAAEFTPNIPQWRADGRIPRGFYRKAGEHGFLCASVPIEYGGSGGDFRFNLAVIEAISRTGIAAANFSVHSDIAANYIVRWGSPRQKQDLLPKMVTGEIVAAIAMTEPGAGSDLRGISTSATKTPGGYRLSGQKTFITNGQNCELVIVVGKTERDAGGQAITLFLVDADSDGFRRGRQLKKMGGHEQDTSELFFSDVFIPDDHVLGAVGDGFPILMQELPTERLSLAVGAISSAETALAITLEYVKQRKAFGQALISFQDTAFRLADLRAHVHAVRAFVNSAIDKYMAGRFNAVDGAEAKLVSTQLLSRVVDECVQMHGGYGWMDEYPISHLYTDARVQRIYGGTDEIMKLIISRDL